MSEDQDLKKMRKAWTAREPTTAEIKDWQNALRQRGKKHRKPLPVWAQWLVAASVGFVIGATVVQAKNFARPTEINRAQNSEADATIEMVYTNWD